MASQVTNEYQPSEVSAPGATLATMLRERGMSQANLALRMGRPAKVVNEIIKGKTRITEETALELERTLGATAGFWLARDARYREWLERARSRVALESNKEWLATVPVKEMERRGWIEATAGAAMRIEQCLRFFGVASVEAWGKQYSRPFAAFRASNTIKSNAAAVAAWLRQGELLASAMDCEPFDDAGFKRVLDESRALTMEPDPHKFMARLREKCASVGVAVVLVQALPGCPMSGATRWLSPGKALLVLSARYRSDDHLWFSFFHEAGHVLLHGKKLLFLDMERSANQIKSREEEQANQFAADHLIPKKYADDLPGLRTERAVRNFARRIGVSPGIVVGRLQHDEVLDYSELNWLKQRYVWGA